MIEVEKKFKPTTEQLEKLLEEAKFLGEKNNHDIYYDYSDFHLMKDKIFLRNRNGRFELKIGGSSGVYEEIENENEIKKYFKFYDANESLQNFVASELIVVTDYVVHRKKYTKEGFVVDVDSCDFGYDMCEIELMVETQEEVPEAEDKILEFAFRYGLESKKGIAKGKMYLKKYKPEVYQEIYRNDK